MRLCPLKVSRMLPFLTSPRLDFRHWTEADLPLAFSLWGNPEVAFYLGGTLTLDATRDKLQVEMDRQQRFGVQYWPIFDRSSNHFAGCCGLRPFRDEPRVFELGVHIARPFWSARLGEEAARAVIAYAFDHLQLEALTAGHNPGNLHSKALIARLGFTYTHMQPWGPHNLEHPFYRLERPGAPGL